MVKRKKCQSTFWNYKRRKRLPALRRALTFAGLIEWVWWEKARVGGEGDEAPFRAEPSLAAASAGAQLEPLTPTELVFAHGCKAVGSEGKAPFITYWLCVTSISLPGNFARTTHLRYYGDAFWGFSLIYIVFSESGEEAEKSFCHNMALADGRVYDLKCFHWLSGC